MKHRATPTKKSSSSNSDSNQSSEEGYAHHDFVGEFHEVRQGTRPFEALLRHETYVHRKCAICARYARRPDEEDFSQVLDIKVYLNIHSMEWVSSEDEFFAWMAKVARNLSTDIFRAGRRRGDMDDTPVEEHALCDLTAPDPCYEAAIKEWLASLSPLRRRIVEMSLAGISLRGIEELLAREGLGRSHTAIGKDLKAAYKAYLEIVGKHPRMP